MDNEHKTLPEKRSPSPDGKKQSMIDWWARTVLMTLYPTLASVLVNLFNNHAFGFHTMIQSGELMMLACLVIVPTLLDYADIPVPKNNEQKAYYALMIVMFGLEGIAYGELKVTDQNLILIYLVSILCFSASVYVSYVAEKLLRGEQK